MDIGSLLLAEILVISKGRAFSAFSGYLTEENSKDFWKSFLMQAAELPPHAPSPQYHYNLQDLYDHVTTLWLHGKYLPNTQ